MYLFLQFFFNNKSVRRRRRRKEMGVPELYILLFLCEYLKRVLRLLQLRARAIWNSNERVLVQTGLVFIPRRRELQHEINAIFVLFNKKIYIRLKQIMALCFTLVEEEEEDDEKSRRSESSDLIQLRTRNRMLIGRQI